MKKLLEQRLQVVTGLDDGRRAVLEESSIDELLLTLCIRTHRLIGEQETCEKLKPTFREFIYNIVGYFHDSGEMDEYVMTNIMTALVTADTHGEGPHGVEDYSTFIRRLNPTDPDTERFFVVGRAGSISEPGCPLREFEGDIDTLFELPSAKLHMFYAFHHARSMDVTRGAPRIPVDEFWRLVPDAIKCDPVLEEVFLDVCFSDGAWELYQLKLAA
jgi:hypothetical protein